jgi:hypothetical protein
MGSRPSQPLTRPAAIAPETWFSTLPATITEDERARGGPAGDGGFGQDVAVEEAHVSIQADHALHSKAKGSGRRLLVHVGRQAGAADGLDLARAHPPRSCRRRCGRARVR